MRQESVVVLQAADDVTRTGSRFDVSQIINMTFQSYCSDTDAAGTVKIQASNDPVTNFALRPNFTPTHWVDVPGKTATITAGSSTFISMDNIACAWIRVVFTQTAPGTGTITVLMNAVGA